ncbi:uncharacterized protein LY89DRAFT_663444 [Mollisia scopiformis]|uniref:Uncharacterized protein n=1 Tax=Mollisia scopiformis TaxID=149040 RepID=A0A194XS35_MOLSC|nr:uncharacterized protein LY89DRAFT_663444 [Mollisia scopiformis]KUJ22956.1 hypothetical protein LY89DRAFT_663444 [Mollisia scopiformis]
MQKGKNGVHHLLRRRVPVTWQVWLDAFSSPSSSLPLWAIASAPKRLVGVTRPARSAPIRARSQSDLQELVPASVGKRGKACACASIRMSRLQPSRVCLSLQQAKVAEEPRTNQVIPAGMSNITNLMPRGGEDSFLEKAFTSLGMGVLRVFHFIQHAKELLYRVLAVVGSEDHVIVNPYRPVSILLGDFSGFALSVGASRTFWVMQEVTWFARVWARSGKWNAGGHAAAVK